MVLKINTQNYCLKIIEDTDLNDIFLFRSNKNLADDLGVNVDTNIEQTRNFVEKIINGINKKDWLYFIVLDKNNNFLGTISIWGFKNNCAQLSYGIMPEYQKKGIMSEVVLKIFEYSFLKLKLEQINVYTNKNNLASNSMLKKLGFKKENEIEENNLKGELVVMNKYVKNNDRKVNV